MIFLLFLVLVSHRSLTSHSVEMYVIFTFFKIDFLSRFTRTNIFSSRKYLINELVGRSMVYSRIIIFLNLI